MALVVRRSKFADLIVNYGLGYSHKTSLCFGVQTLTGKIEGLPVARATEQKSRGKNCTIFNT